MAIDAPSEVKGIMIVTLRKYILEEHGEQVFDRYVASAPDETRVALREPLASRWYPEVVMRDALEACHRAVCNGSDPLFTHARARGATLGTHWFFRMLLSVTTPRYMMRLMPTALRQMRRGPVKLEMPVNPSDATLRVSDHPFADHPLYRLATPAMLGAVVRLCTPVARVTLVDWRRRRWSRCTGARMGSPARGLEWVAPALEVRDVASVSTSRTRPWSRSTPAARRAACSYGGPSWGFP